MYVLIFAILPWTLAILLVQFNVSKARTNSEKIQQKQMTTRQAVPLGLARAQGTALVLPTKPGLVTGF
jgi:Flp pilus assembly protein protease CpaA